MPAPYLLTCPLRSPDLARFLPQQLRSLGEFCYSLTVGPTGAAGSGPANSPLLPLDSAEHQL